MTGFRVGFSSFRKCNGATSPVYLVAWVLCLAISSGRAQIKATASPPQESVPPDILNNPPDDALAEEIDSLIRRLGFPVYRERQLVTGQLMEINAPALAQLRVAYVETNDLEVRLRIEKIVHGIYFDYYVFNRNGFLGIQMAAYNEVVHTKTRVPDGRAGMYISSVIRNTGAARAGLLKGDVIIAIDGVPLEGGPKLTASFSASIRAKRPGDVMNLTIVRVADILSIPATLGRCSEETARKRRVVGTSELYLQKREEFPQWWLSHFHDPIDSADATEDP